MEEDDRSMVTPGKTEIPEKSPVRNSIEKATLSKTGESILPHYLRASTGSCHDFCKFGRQHAFDAKARRSMPERFQEVLALPEKKKTALPAQPLSVSKLFDSSERYSRSKSIIKKEIVNDGKPLMVKTRPSISSKMSNSNTPKAKKMEIPSSFRLKVNSSTSTNIRENTRTRTNRDVETGRIMGTSNIASKVLLSSPKVSLSPKPVNRIANLITRKQKSRKVASPHVNSSSRIRKDESVGTSNIASKKVLSSPNVSLSPKPVDRIANLIARKQMSRKVASPHVNSSSRIRKDESVGTSNIASKKVLSSPNVSLSPKPVDRIANLIARKQKSRKVASPHVNSSSRIRKDESVGTSNIAPKKVLSSPNVSLSPKPVDRITNLITRKQMSRKVASPHVNSSSRIRKDESNRPECDEVEEKTLYVIKMETGKKPQFSSSPLLHDVGGDRDEGENTANEAEYESFSEIDDIKKVIDKKGSFKKVDSPPPSKLSFRRGKVVAIQSLANSPRRLKFRQARLLGENQKIVDPRRNLKKVKEFDCKMATNSEKSVEKVVLRHQDMQGKKDTQGLFNNVIEVTASKLVETRKSKVKALVGAFETVISLQEIKPSVR